MQSHFAFERTITNRSSVFLLGKSSSSPSPNTWLKFYHQTSVELNSQHHNHSYLHSNHHTLIQLMLTHLYHSSGLQTECMPCFLNASLDFQKHGQKKQTPNSFRSNSQYQMNTQFHFIHVTLILSMIAHLYHQLKSSYNYTIWCPNTRSKYYVIHSIFGLAHFYHPTDSLSERTVAIRTYSQTNEHLNHISLKITMKL